MWVKLYDPSEYTLNNNDNGLATITLDVSIPKAYAYIYPDDGYDSNDWNPRTLNLKAADRRGPQPSGWPSWAGADSYHPLYAHQCPVLDPASFREAGVILLWSKSFEQGLAAGTIGTEIGYIPDQTSPADAEKVAFEYRFHFATGITNNEYQGMQYIVACPGSGASVMLWYTDSGHGTKYQVEHSYLDWKIAYLSKEHLYGSGWNWDEEMKWHLGDGQEGDYYFGNPFAIWFAFKSTEVVSPGTLVGKLYEARLRIPFRVRLGMHPALSWPFGFGGAPPKLFDNIQLAVECQGIKYDSGIIGSHTHYSTSDMNTSPPYIIQDILRNVCGTSAIDTNSFDEADGHLPVMYASGPTPLAWFDHHIALTNKEAITDWKDSRPMAKSIIREILRQSPYAMCVTAQRKARMLDITDTDSLYQNATEILVADLDLAQLKISRTRVDQLTNDLIIEYMRRSQDGVLSYVVTESDSVSSGRYGQRQDRLALDYLGGGYFDGTTLQDHRAAAWIKDWFLGDPWSVNNGSSRGKFLSEPKNIVEFFVPGIAWLHLELGDYIKFESKLDEHMKLFGETWGSRAFMIVEKQVSSTGVTFVAIEPLVET